MRTVVRTERIGERVGDIDWGYDFSQHFQNICGSEEDKLSACEVVMERLQNIERHFKDGLPIKATTYDGWPRCCFGEVIDVGMYDGIRRHSVRDEKWKKVPSRGLSAYSKEITHGHFIGRGSAKRFEAVWKMF